MSIQSKPSEANEQQLGWLRSVRDYSDGVKGYGGYVTAGPKTGSIDKRLRKLGYVAGLPGFAPASVITDAGRAALIAQDMAGHPSDNGAS